MSDVAAMYADMKRYRDEAVRLQQEVIVWQQEAQSAERKAAARIAELEAALKPFAEKADGVLKNLHGGHVNYIPELISVTLGDLRAARAALEKK